MIKKNEIKALRILIDKKQPKQELQFALASNGNLYSTDTYAVLKIKGVVDTDCLGLIHSSILHAIEKTATTKEHIKIDNNNISVGVLRVPIHTAISSLDATNTKIDGDRLWNQFDMSAKEEGIINSLLFSLAKHNVRIEDKYIKVLETVMDEGQYINIVVNKATKSTQQAQVLIVSDRIEMIIMATE